MGVELEEGVGAAPRMLLVPSSSVFGHSCFDWAAGRRSSRHSGQCLWFYMCLLYSFLGLVGCSWLGLHALSISHTLALTHTHTHTHTCTHILPPGDGRDLEAAFLFHPTAPFVLVAIEDADTGLAERLTVYTRV